MPDALELLKTRRSFKAVELSGPGPSVAEIDTLLTVASRVPDHGKLAPWRFIVFEGQARRAAGEAIASAFRTKYPDAKPEHVAAERKRLMRAPLAPSALHYFDAQHRLMLAHAIKCASDAAEFARSGSGFLG